jgi:3-phenylpropionate/trans-cinnamate dioxygenase ferredoxin reductase subunit
MDRFEIAIAGGGLAAAKTVESYRDAGGEGSIVVVAREQHPPYHRPPLSKRLLRGEAEPDSTLVKPAEWYAEHDVDLRSGSEALGLDVDRRVLNTDRGEIEFERLVIATGALPRPLDGAMLLRTVDDSLAIRERAKAGGRAVVVGTGFIGCEVSASLRALDVDVLLSTGGRPLFGALASPDFSAYLERLYRAHDVELAAEAAERDGDFVVAGIGVEPATRWLDGSGIDVDDGVLVNDRFETTVQDVYAIGDLARFHDPVFGHTRRIEHWSNANYQGTQLGTLLATGEGGYDTVSSFFTELFGNTFRFFGDVGHEAELEGSFDDGRAILRHREDGRLVGALVLGLEDDEQDELKDAIREAQQ